jgi:hypothetical protein
LKTKLAIAVLALVIGITISVAVCFQTHNVMAKETPSQAGYDHGCADLKLTLSERHINVHGKGQSNTQEFMTGYNMGIKRCRSHGQCSPIVVSIAGNANSSKSVTNSSRLSFKEGYAKGVLDAKLEKNKFPVSTFMRPEDVDCDSDIDPRMSNEDYCAGYQHGFAYTFGNKAS